MGYRYASGRSTLISAFRHLIGLGSFAFRGVLFTQFKVQWEPRGLLRLDSATPKAIQGDGWQEKGGSQRNACIWFKKRKMLSQREVREGDIKMNAFHPMGGVSGIITSRYRMIRESGAEQRALTPINLVVISNTSRVLPAPS